MDVGISALGECNNDEFPLEEVPMVNGIQSDAARDYKFKKRVEQLATQHNLTEHKVYHEVISCFIVHTAEAVAV